MVEMLLCLLVEMVMVVLVEMVMVELGVLVETDKVQVGMVEELLLDKHHKDLLLNLYSSILDSYTVSDMIFLLHKGDAHTLKHLPKFLSLYHKEDPRIVLSQFLIRK